MGRRKKQPTFLEIGHAVQPPQRFGSLGVLPERLIAHGGRHGAEARGGEGPLVGGVSFSDQAKLRRAAGAERVTAVRAEASVTGGSGSPTAPGWHKGMPAYPERRSAASRSP